MPIDLPPLFAHSTMSDSTESFACKVHNLYVEIIKHIQASNKQHKFRVDLQKYHDALNVRDYLMIQIRPERYPLRISHKLLVLDYLKCCK
jgi:hypothetical protein